VEAGADVPIEVDYSGAIEITDLDVYTIPWEAKPAPDWRSAAGDLRAFTDAPEPQLENDVEFIAASLSAAPFVARGPEDEEAAVGLIALMYERPKLAHFCRRIVLKAFGDAEALERLWARAIVDVCEHGCIAGEMRPLFWRDFALLPLAERDRIGAVVWGSMGDGPGIYAVIAGLGE
jgi:hypothetical protein